MIDRSSVVETVYTAISIIRDACKKPCARSICEDLEDMLISLLDEAGDTEQVSPTALLVIERTASLLLEAAKRAERQGCDYAAILFRQASELLEKMIEGGFIVDC